MDRRDWLATLGMAGTTGFALLAGCGTKSGDAGNDTGQRDSKGTNGGKTGNENNSGDTPNGTDAGEGATGNDARTPSGSTGDVTTESAQTLDTGQAPPSDTGTPFENTNTVPERGGLETGRAPNATDE